MMGNEGLVTAFDISAKRAKLMKQMTIKAGALKTGDGDGGCVEIRNEDFLALNPNDEACKETEFIVVDPSCSGSGWYTSTYGTLGEKNLDLNGSLLHGHGNLPLVISNFSTGEAVLEGEEGFKSLALHSTAHKVYSTSIYKVAADNLG